jgi:hypothetical protein
MKKLIFALAMVAVASTAMGAVGIEFGANWFKPNMNPNSAGYDWFGQGQNVTITWALENDFALGVYVENTMLNDGYGNTEPFNVNAMQVRKGIVKNVDVGMNLGTFYQDWGGYTGMLTDVFGEVTVLSGKGEKVEGALKGQAGGRWADASWQGGSYWGSNWNGYFVNLLVAILL